jgi:FKBP-type peptidyl-prolyl cis-trans isomerase
MKEGDLAAFELIMKNQRDSVVVKLSDDLYLRKHTRYTDLMDVIAKMNEGDSAIIQMSVDSLFTYDVQSLRGLKPGEKAMIHLHLKHILTASEKEAEINKRKEAKRKMEEDAKVAYHEQYKKDSVIILDYIKKNKITGYKTTPEGIVYQITKAGDGKLPNPGDSIYANYVGTLTDGQGFDKSKDAPIGFRVGAGEVIPGWDAAFALLSKGTKAKLIIPSTMAYGPRPSGPIPANSVLVFDIEVVNIVAGKNVPDMRMHR